MEHKASDFEPEDVISRMPDIVVTRILDRLPVKDAVKTGILSKNWRFKWTMLSQLIFDKTFFVYLLRTQAVSKFGRVISRLLLNLKGAITKFSIYIDQRCYLVLDDEDIAHWILFLSTKGVKDLTICKMYGPLLKLPTHLFSCLELKHLNLFYCCFDPPASFHGFPNLLSLELGHVQFESSKFGELITRCPLLQTLKMFLLPTSKVKLVEIAKLANLKILFISLVNLDKRSSNTIFELVGFLPKLEELDLDLGLCKFTEDAARNRSTTSLPTLKALTLTGIDLGNGIMLSCAFQLIRCSPNMQTLEITIFECDADPPPAIPDVEYNTMGPLQLRRVVFQNLKGLENEVCLIKYLLACSPFLKKMVIHPHLSLALDENLFAKKLLKLSRASPIAVIDLD